LSLHLKVVSVKALPSSRSSFHSSARHSCGRPSVWGVREKELRCAARAANFFAQRQDSPSGPKIDPTTGKIVGGTYDGMTWDEVLAQRERFNRAAAAAARQGLKHCSLVDTLRHAIARPWRHPKLGVLSYAVVGQHLGVDKKTVHRWCHGARLPAPWALDLIRQLVKEYRD
jgi:hypothetical protein